MRAALTFNAGPGWMRAGLGNAVQRGDASEVRRIFLQYNRAGGEILPGLTARRREEAAWMSNGDTRSVIPRPETRLAEVSVEARQVTAHIVRADGLVKPFSNETASTTPAQHCDAQAFYEQIKWDQLRLLTLRHEKRRDETFAVAACDGGLSGRKGIFALCVRKSCHRIDHQEDAFATVAEEFRKGHRRLGSIAP